MEYLTLHNGVQMPLVGFGTFMLSEKTCNRGSCFGNRKRLSHDRYGGSLRQRKSRSGEGMKKSGIDRKELFLVTKGKLQILT